MMIIIKMIIKTIIKIIKIKIHVIILMMYICIVYYIFDNKTANVQDIPQSKQVSPYHPVYKYHKILTLINHLLHQSPFQTYVFQSKQVSRSHAFPSMNMNQRRLIHELAEHYGCTTQSYDYEPKKNVVATAPK